MMRLNPKYIPLLATAAVLILVFGTGSVLYPNFGTPRVIVNLLGDQAFVGVAAVGESFVILSGGIDLSVGSMVALVGILIARLLQAGCDPFVAMAIAVCFGTVAGAVMGCLIHYFEMPPFLVTLAGLFCLRGLGFVVHPESIGIDHPFYAETVPQLSILVAPKAVLPFTAICFLASVVVGTFVAGFTRFGRYVYAIGSSESSARLMGVPIGRTKITTYALAGFFSACGGVVSTFYMQSGNPASFVGLELDAIAGVVIGGTLLTGGVGFVPGTLMGMLILGLIQTIITFNGTLNSWWTKIVIGALLLIFIVPGNVAPTPARTEPRPTRSLALASFIVGQQQVRRRPADPILPLAPALRLSYLVFMEWLFWAVLSALFAGATAILAKIGVAEINSNLATAIRTTVILLFSWSIVLATSRVSELWSIGRKSWIFLVLSGIATGLSWLCYFRALQLGEVSKVAPIDKLSVVVAIVLAVSLLGEKLSVRDGIGAGLIVLGAIVLAWR